MLYGDPTFTGRTIIWDFSLSEIARRPLFGWGYQSFWLVGSDAPSVVDAPAFVGSMPNSHNGYYDTMLELGYVGYCFLIVFILATVHVIGRAADRDRNRAWFALTAALYVIIYNYLETFWMRSSEFMWVAFVLLAVDIGRYWEPSPLKGAVQEPGNPRPGTTPGGGRLVGGRPGSPSPARRAGTLGPQIPIKRPGLTPSMHESDRNWRWKADVDEADAVIRSESIRVIRSDGSQS
jgi:exopolysaccharide production protein ExoQ